MTRREVLPDTRVEAPAPRHAPAPVRPSPVVDPYRPEDGIYRPGEPLAHCEEEYPSHGFDVLRTMQERHFWYRGRHRFLLHAVKRRLDARPTPNPLRIVDLGCGCGGWLAHCTRRMHLAEAEWAAADSSAEALRFAGRDLPSDVKLFEIDLKRLAWQNRWDAAFLLDVLEHLDDDLDVLRQVRDALAPGGLLFVTVPAFGCFWTWNDDLAGHKRRYAKGQMAALAAKAGLAVCDVRYFMFFLSPLLLASRWLARVRLRPGSAESAKRLQSAMHRVPGPLVNGVLGAAFAAETPVGHYLRFPWGTSLLGVFQKPC